MTTKFLTATLLTFISFYSLFAQDTTRAQFYTGFYNQLSGDVRYPVLGFVNVVDGTQKGTQIGFSNYTSHHLNGFQFALTNIIGGNGNGVQLGIANITKDSFTGAQISCVNLTGKEQQGAQIGFINLAENCTGAVQVGAVNVSEQETKGIQAGFVNATGKDLDGGQVGFVNITGGDTKGTQVGFVNANTKDVDGAQVGFVNIVGNKTAGTQIGFVNVSKTIKGTQVGFVNIVDSFSSGIPVGFLSISRKNGYYAFEISSNELYYYNASFKVGVKPLYTSFGLSYNPNFLSEFAWNAGIGSMLYVSPSVFFNPEITAIGSIEETPQFFSQLSTSVGYTSGILSFKVGPTFTWGHLTTPDNPSDVPSKMYQPEYSFYKTQLDDQNSFFIGAKAAIVVSF
jgi:hypothetical protein